MAFFSIGNWRNGFHFPKAEINHGTFALWLCGCVTGAQIGNLGVPSRNSRTTITAGWCCFFWLESSMFYRRDVGSVYQTLAGFSASLWKHLKSNRLLEHKGWQIWKLYLNARWASRKDLCDKYSIKAECVQGEKPVPSCLEDGQAERWHPVQSSTNAFWVNFVSFLFFSFLSSFHQSVSGAVTGERL